MTRRRAAALATLTLAVALVCGRGAAADFTIVQKNKAFSVRQIVIRVGDRITFVNEDSVNHNVYSETKGSEFDFPQHPGRADSVRFSQPGTIEIQCAIHPVMKLEVQVRQ
jgi:plastocyanin